MPSKPCIQVARPVAPEDLRAGDYVCMLTYTVQFIPCASQDDVRWDKVRVVGVDVLPLDITPRRVVSACLPYLLVKCPAGGHETLDTRRVRLARVTPRFGAKAFKKLAGREEP
jgi:hypothetical protein